MSGVESRCHAQAPHVGGAGSKWSACCKYYFIFNEISFEIKFMLPHTHKPRTARRLSRRTHSILSLSLSLSLILEAFSIRSRERKTLIE